ncbi:MAG: transketolase [Dehalococcoidia bacterium]|nr:transketolase [Dehalococcoidia bacterium]
MARTQTVSTAELKTIARRIRRHIIVMTSAANSGHPGGSLSSVEIMAALYFRLMRHDPQNPLWPDRDRFVMSKGHASPLMYATLAEAGYFPVEELKTFRQLGSRLQGHNIMHNPPGVEMSAGALGMGLSFSLGQALAARLDGRDSHVYCLIGDGDSQEGQTWEAALSCAHHKVDNLTVIMDRNHIQNDGFSDYARFNAAAAGDGQPPDRPGGWVLPDGHTANIMALDPLDEKWRAFGWKVWGLADGHDPDAITGALEEARAHKGQPAIVICETVKGKGVSFMENNPDFHGKAASPEEEQQALRELGDE